MTALTVVRGRRGVPNLVTLRQTELDDLRDELTALTAEGVELAARIVAIARRAEARVARGISPADLLDELERLGLQHGIRMTAAAIEQRITPVVHESCVDEHTPGCGRAA